MDQPAKQVENSPKEDAKMADEAAAVTDKPDATAENTGLGLASGEKANSKVAPPVNIGVHIPSKPEE